MIVIPSLMPIPPTVAGIDLIIETIGTATKKLRKEIFVPNAAETLIHDNIIVRLTQSANSIFKIPFLEIKLKERQ